MVVSEVQVQQFCHFLQNKNKFKIQKSIISFWNKLTPIPLLLARHKGTCELSYTYFEGLVVDTLGADVVMAAVDQGHGVREAWQL